MKKDDEKEIDTFDYLGSAASAGDCTGLIPAGEGGEEDLERYRELYPFGAPRLEEKRTTYKNKKE